MPFQGSCACAGAAAAAPDAAEPGSGPFGEGRRYGVVGLRFQMLTGGPAHDVDGGRPAGPGAQGRAPWRTRTSRPSTTVHPRACAAARSAVSPWRWTRSTTIAHFPEVIGRQGQLLERGWSSPCRPTAVQLTSRSAGCGALDGADAEVGGQRLGPRGGAVPDRDVGRPACEQRPHDGAGAAAGAEHERACARARARRARRCSPGASVLSAWIAPSGGEGQRVRGADRARALGRLVGERERGLLVRDRHVRADEARLPAARGPSRRTARAGPGAAGSASPVRPSSASAALCIAGERLCATGQPRTPRRASAALAARRGSLPPRSARCVVGGDVASNCASVARRRARRAARLDDVVEVLRPRRGAAAWIEASPGLPIGVGGRPACVRVL